MKTLKNDPILILLENKYEALERTMFGMMDLTSNLQGSDLEEKANEILKDLVNLRRGLKKLRGFIEYKTVIH